MKSEARAVQTISWGLALVFFVSMLFCDRFNGTDKGVHSYAATFLFGLMFVASLVTIRLQNWGRKALRVFSIIMTAYMVSLFFVSGYEVVFVAYALLGIVVFLYYGQDKTRVSFVAGKAFERKSVLIVDDDPGLIKTVKPLLLNKGYSVLTANSGEKGMQIAKSQKPDVIILDVILPGIKGREVCQKLKEDKDTERIPVIFLTAKDSPDDVKAELEVGALTHITKPFSAHKLLEEISKALK